MASLEVNGSQLWWHSGRNSATNENFLNIFGQNKNKSKTFFANQNQNMGMMK
jgi:hypothetical protein